MNKFCQYQDTPGNCGYNGSFCYTHICQYERNKDTAGCSYMTGRHGGFVNGFIAGIKEVVEDLVVLHPNNKPKLGGKVRVFTGE